MCEDITLLAADVYPAGIIMAYLYFKVGGKEVYTEQLRGIHGKGANPFCGAKIKGDVLIFFEE